MCFLINVLDQTTKTMQDMYFIIMVIFSGRKQHCTRMILYVHFRVPYFKSIAMHLAGAKRSMWIADRFCDLPENRG